MKYRTKKEIISDNEEIFNIGDIVTFHTLNGGGCGGCKITKITDSGFKYIQGTSKEKSVQYVNVISIEK